MGYNGFKKSEERNCSTEKKFRLFLLLLRCFYQIKVILVEKMVVVR